MTSCQRSFTSSLIVQASGAVDACLIRSRGCFSEASFSSMCPKASSGPWYCGLTPQRQEKGDFFSPTEQCIWMDLSYTKTFQTIKSQQQPFKSLQLKTQLQLFQTIKSQHQAFRIRRTQITTTTLSNHNSSITTARLYVVVRHQMLTSVIVQVNSQPPGRCIANSSPKLAA